VEIEELKRKNSASRSLMANGFFIWYNFGMCLAMPSKIIKIEGDWATVQSEKHIHKANLSLVKGVKVGDYIIVHADLVLNKINKQEAEKILKMIKKINK